MKPILFNTAMVQAILSGQKTETRRLIKPQPAPYCSIRKSPSGAFWMDFAGIGTDYTYKPPHNVGDILYVRETWRLFDPHEDFKHGNRTACLQYFSDLHGAYSHIVPDWEKYLGNQWHSPVSMPKEFARIFLRVTDVWAERLRKIRLHECVAEGFVKRPDYTKRHDLVLHARYLGEFAQTWNNTIKPTELDRYGFDANPWVWVITFERCAPDVEEHDGTL